MMSRGTNSGSLSPRRGSRSGLGGGAGASRPAGEGRHWQDGRSAKELANAWISGCEAAALIALLNLAPATASLRIDRAVAGGANRLRPLGRASESNYDLLVTGEALGGE